jgi:hypothetical protein
LSDILINENIALEQRKEQALQLNINVQNHMTQETIEQEIILKLESGMKDLKAIVDQMNLLE